MNIKTVDFVFVYKVHVRCMQGAETLREMLDKAKVYIPEKKWHETPVSLKATAGLRLLDEADSTALLNSVSALRALCKCCVYASP